MITKDDDKAIQCAICKKIFDDKIEFHEHFDTDHPDLKYDDDEDDKNCDCPVCKEIENRKLSREKEDIEIKKSPKTEKVPLAGIYKQGKGLFVEMTDDCDPFQMLGFLETYVVKLKEDLIDGFDREGHDNCDGNKK